jgi:hypothetical protein
MFPLCTTSEYAINFTCYKVCGNVLHAITSTFKALGKQLKMEFGYYIGIRKWDNMSDCDVEKNAV